MNENGTILTSKVLIHPECVDDFVDWQAKLNAAIAEQQGFVSLEILSPSMPEQSEWLLVERFYSPVHLTCWQESSSRQNLMKQLEHYLKGDPKTSKQEITSNPNHLTGGVTEVFVTKVNPENEKAYREWMGKIHQMEAKFPGFKGVYMQSPTQSWGINWITLLQFDTPENLDFWLNSPERKQILAEAETLISLLESHRVISPYGGWFASIAKGKMLPAVWKQTMIVLLVLFPIVMFEFKYLNPLTRGLNLSLATFIGNALSVLLILWPMTPIAIFFLRWWLTPKNTRNITNSVVGALVVLFLYLIEIIIFWNFI